jgi:hypothetical protein
MMLCWLVVSILLAAVGSGILLQAKTELKISLGFFLARWGAVSIIIWCWVAAVETFTKANQ